MQIYEPRQQSTCRETEDLLCLIRFFGRLNRQDVDDTSGIDGQGGVFKNHALGDDRNDPAGFNEGVDKFHGGTAERSMSKVEICAEY